MALFIFQLVISVINFNMMAELKRKVHYRYFCIEDVLKQVYDIDIVYQNGRPVVIKKKL